MRRIKGKIFFLLLLCAVPSHSYAAMSQQIILGLPSATYTKTTLSRTYSGAGPIGFAGEYGLFLNSNLCVAGQFELNLESYEQTAVLIGGGVGIKYFAVGGEKRSIADTYVKGASWPRWNLFFLAGLGGKQFDFTVPEKAAQPQEEGTIVQKDAKDFQKGSAIGLNFGLGLSVPVMNDMEPGFRAQIFQSFSAANQPTISVVSLWLSVGFNL